jgi:hypothetical protein
LTHSRSPVERSAWGRDDRIVDVRTATRFQNDIAGSVELNLPRLRSSTSVSQCARYSRLDE